MDAAVHQTGEKSMLALLQRVITCLLLGAACGWLLYFGRSAPLLAITGFLVIALGYTAVLGAECIIAWRINQRDPVPQPGVGQRLAAWPEECAAAPQVFCWRQPFRPHAIADQLEPERTRGRRGVVFIHGFFCNRGFWTPWLKRLRGSGHAFVALDLEPVFGSIDAYVPQIDDAVRRVTLATGMPPLLVCHSMGGLAARAWLQQMRAEARVWRVVTLATPHRGTWLARFGHGDNGRQMRLLSDWLAQLDHGMPADRHTLFTCWYSNCDNIVFPASSATLPGADNRLVPGVAHVQLAFVPQVIHATLALLDARLP